MQIVKALLGGVIGGLVGAAVWLWLEGAMSRSLPVGVLLAGLGAGFGTRLLCASGCNLFTGIIAAVMSLVGIIGASYASSAIASNSEPDFKIPNTVATSPADAGGDEDAADEQMDAADEVDDAEPGERDSDSGAAEDEVGEQPDTTEPDDAAASSDAETTDTASTEAPSEESVQAEESGTRSYHSSGDNLPMDYPKYERKTDWSFSEVAFNSLSALIAFVLGAGPFQLTKTEEAGSKTKTD